MGRALRIDYPGAWYHVMNRGGAYSPIFKYERHFELYKSLKSIEQLPFKPTDNRIKRPSLQDIVSTISNTTHTNIDTILSAKKIRNNARELVMFIAKNNYAYELSEIASLMKMKAASSVSTSALRTTKRLKNDPELNDALLRTLELLNN